jgi:LPXTG-site transpeptidase (sortase) family protein
MRENKQYWYAFGSILVFLVVSIGVSGWLWSRYHAPQPRAVHQATATLPAQKSTVQVTPAGQERLNMHEAVELVIPSIDVKASVEPVGTDNQGRMDVPHDNRWEHVGWYQEGPVPGQQGSAVIDGHLDRPGGLPAVFWNLHKLHEGDAVLVKDTKGHTLHFRVYKVQTYTPDAAPAEQIFANASGTYLNLITCAGEWIPEQHQTSQRLVVYTKLEKTQPVSK